MKYYNLFCKGILKKIKSGLFVAREKWMNLNLYSFKNIKGDIMVNKQGVKKNEWIRCRNFCRDYWYLVILLNICYSQLFISLISSFALLEHNFVSDKGYISSYPDYLLFYKLRAFGCNSDYYDLYTAAGYRFCYPKWLSFITTIALLGYLHLEIGKYWGKKNVMVLYLFWWHCALCECDYLCTDESNFVG